MAQPGHDYTDHRQDHAKSDEDGADHWREAAVGDGNGDGRTTASAIERKGRVWQRAVVCREWRSSEKAVDNVVGESTAPATGRKEVKLIS